MWEGGRVPTGASPAPAVLLSSGGIAGGTTGTPPTPELWDFDPNLLGKLLRTVLTSLEVGENKAANVPVTVETIQRLKG